MKHTPVYLEAVIDALAPQRGKRYIDATLGEAGHLDKLIGTGAHVLAIDADIRQVEKARARYPESDNLVIVQGNFRSLGDIAKSHGFTRVNGVLFDLGLSYGQIADSNKGFSFKNENEILDMRLDVNSGIPAHELLLLKSEDELESLFMTNAEEINSHRIAQSISARRVRQPVKTVGDLTACIDEAVGKRDVHTYARIFQALRIEVNDEFNSLRTALESAWEMLIPSGVLAVISFHSLEDRIVKRFMQQHSDASSSAGKFKNYRDAAPFEKSALLRTLVKK